MVFNMKPIKRYANDEEEFEMNPKLALDLIRFSLILELSNDLGLDEAKLEEAINTYKLNILSIVDLGHFLYEIVNLYPSLKDEYQIYSRMGRKYDIQSIVNRNKLIKGCLKYLQSHPQSKAVLFTNEGSILTCLTDIIQAMTLDNGKSIESLKALINIPVFLVLKAGSKSPQDWISTFVYENLTNSTKTELVDQNLAINQSYVNLAEEIKDLDSKIRITPANTQDYTDLNTQRADKLTNLIKQVQQNESDPETTLKILTSSIHSNSAFATATGARLGLTPDQELAMIVNGKAIIAAGAGSGKTRVLAGRVAWLIKEKGVPSSNIIATSFTRLASHELKSRILNPQFAGDTAFSSGSEGFGTTHSIGNAILRHYDAKARNKGSDMNLDSKAVRVALNQVGMLPTSLNVPSMEIKSLFQMPPFEPYNPPSQATPVPVVQYTIEDIENYKQLIGDFISFANYYITKIPLTNVSPQVLAENSQKKEDLARDLTVLNEIKNKGLLPNDLSLEQKAYLNNLIASKKGELVFNNLKQKGLKNLDNLSKISADMEYDLEKEKIEEKAKKKEEAPPASKSPYYKTPANMWFNIGFDPELIKEKLKKATSPSERAKWNRLYDLLKEKYEEKTENFFIRQCANFYGNCLSPADLQAKGEDTVMVAVYGAFLWVKQNDPTYTGFISSDDMLIQSVRLMVEEPFVLHDLRKKFKHIMVDEAQDLNNGQHLFFGLIAGTIDPSTLKPYQDGRPMTADSFVLIGDDKQAIYEFRGATPQEFIGKSDLKHGPFKTQLITTNFRSGKDIIDSANRLIALNTDQIPMVCTTTPTKGFSSIVHEPADDDFVESAKDLLTDIQNQIELGATPEDFGIGTTRRKDTFPFVVECLIRNVPFRSRSNPFNKSNIKQILEWLLFASTSKQDTLNQLCLSLFKQVGGPTFYLGKVFEDKVRSAYLQAVKTKGVTKGLYDWFTDNYSTLDYDKPKTKENVRTFVSTLIYARQLALIHYDDAFKLLLALLELEDANSNRFGTILFPTKGKQGEDADNSEEDEDENESKDLGLLSKVFHSFGEKVTPSQVLSKIFEFQKILDEAEKSKKGIFIDTIHQWKGLECKNMTCVFPFSFPRNHSEDENVKHLDGVERSKKILELEQAERRLAYVALTRGQDSVKVLGNYGKYGPSRFISEGCIPTLTSLTTNAVSGDGTKMASTLDTFLISLRKT